MKAFLLVLLWVIQLILGWHSYRFHSWTNKLVWCSLPISGKCIYKKTVLWYSYLFPSLWQSETDKMTKMRPFYKFINDRCLKFRENDPNLAVDETMISCFGKTTVSNKFKISLCARDIRCGYLRKIPGILFDSTHTGGRNETNHNVQHRTHGV